MDALVTQQLTISPELIQLLGKKLYNNPLIVILVRELLQNSHDAQSTKIDLDVSYQEDNEDFNKSTVTLTCTDNGTGMSEDTLLNTFLSIGASKKIGITTGGFGIAKVSIFASLSWQVVTWQGGEYLSIASENMILRRKIC